MMIMIIMMMMMMTQDWGTEDGRLIYSLAVAGVQFLLPLTVLALVHAREETSIAR